MIYILGGRGFVGSAYARYCESHSLPHVVITRQNYAEYVGHPCDLFINANGNSRKYLAQSDPLLEFDQSVRSVRASLIDFPSERYVFLSSCDVYEDCSSPATTPEDLLPNPAKQSPYGFHKYLAEQCVRHGAKHWLIVRLGGFVGPGLKKNPIYDILNGGPLWVDPSSELQFLHTDDASRLVYGLINSGITREVVNVCGRDVIELNDVITETGHKIEVKPDSPIVRYEVSTAKLETMLVVPTTRETVMSFVREGAAPSSQ